MTEEILTAEAFAHYIRGAITLFLALKCGELWRFRNRNKMFRLLFFTLLAMTLCYAKDVVLLFPQLKVMPEVDDLVGLLDLLPIPLACSLFIELARPGYTTTVTTVSLLAIQTLFIPLYFVLPASIVAVAAYATASVFIAYAAVTVVVYTLMYNRYIEQNYSYRENIEVKWVRRSFLLFIALFLGDILIYQQATWTSEAVYNVLMLGLWFVVTHFVANHKIVANTREVVEAMVTQPAMMKSDESSQNSEPSALSENSEDSENSSENSESSSENSENSENSDTPELSKNYDFIAKRLPECMERERLFLNPKVSIFDVALAMGTNKTYLSDYLNRRLGVTFYDYINEFRIREACAVIEAMAGGERKPMTEVAQMSGFNSLSSFNRYFKKAKGVSPKEYATSLISAGRA